MKNIYSSILLAILLTLVSFLVPVTAQAEQGSVLGIHILSPDELEPAKQLVAKDASDEWHYMTIPLSLDDIKDKDRWQNFFKEARKQKVIPIVRLVSRFEDGAWKVPNRKEITDQVAFLSDLEWPTDQKHLIVFNEVNHAPEWGGTIDPQSYAEILSFTAQWARSEDLNYVVLPAAMDLAAPNGSSTMEAFNYLEQMLAADPEVFNNIHAWNSHSYPNPGFSSSPQGTAKNSLRGFEHELAFVKEKTDKDFKVFITETGWVANNKTTPWLESYYTYALQHIWSDDRIIAVTPFVLRGDPGPFSGFAFLDRNNQPTSQYIALQKALQNSVQ